MKVEFKLLAIFTLLALAISCGKNNESGKKTNSCSGYGVSGLCNSYPSTLIGIAGSNVSVQAIANEHPCVIQQAYQNQYYQQYPNQYNNQAYPQQSLSMQRTPVPLQVTTNSVVPAGDVYVGVTSLGDIAVLTGSGSMQSQLVAYLCPRSMPVSGTLISAPLIGAYTMCAVKDITRANMQLSDGTQIFFRPLSPGGNSNGAKFSFCQR